MKTQFRYRKMEFNVAGAELCFLRVHQRWTPKLNKHIKVQVCYGDSLDPLVITEVDIPTSMMSKRYFFNWAKAQGFDDCQIIGQKENIASERRTW